jgi:hypothetical protein
MSFSSQQSVNLLTSDDDNNNKKENKEMGEHTRILRIPIKIKIKLELPPQIVEDAHPPQSPDDRRRPAGM